MYCGLPGLLPSNLSVMCVCTFVPILASTAAVLSAYLIDDDGGISLGVLESTRALEAAFPLAEVLANRHILDTSGFLGDGSLTSTVMLVNTWSFELVLVMRETLLVLNTTSLSAQRIFRTCRNGRNPLCHG
jgi:hypothetical protein